MRDHAMLDGHRDDDDDDAGHGSNHGHSTPKRVCYCFLNAMATYNLALIDHEWQRWRVGAIAIVFVALRRTRSS